MHENIVSSFYTLTNSKHVNKSVVTEQKKSSKNCQERHLSKERDLKEDDDKTNQIRQRHCGCVYYKRISRRSLNLLSLLADKFLSG